MIARGGFTLIEMLVVLVLISLSVSLIYPSLFNTRDHFDAVLDAASKEQDRKREKFAKFITDGLPMRNHSTAGATGTAAVAEPQRLATEAGAPVPEPQPASEAVH